MRTLFLLLPLLAITSLPAHAQKGDWPVGSGRYMVEHHDDNANYFGELLEKRHRELVALVDHITQGGDPYLIDTLNKQHTEWKKYKSNDCALIGALEPAIGLARIVTQSRCESNLVDRRFRSVSHAVACIKAIPESTRSAEMSRCLYQLSPLTTGK